MYTYMFLKMLQFDSECFNLGQKKTFGSKEYFQRTDIFHVFNVLNIFYNS